MDVAEVAAILTAQTTLKVVVVQPVIRHALLTAKIAQTTPALADALVPHAVQVVAQIATKHVLKIVKVIVVMDVLQIAEEDVLLPVKQDVGVSVIGLAEAHAISNVRGAV